MSAEGCPKHSRSPRTGSISPPAHSQRPAALGRPVSRQLLRAEGGYFADHQSGRAIEGDLMTEYALLSAQRGQCVRLGINVDRCIARLSRRAVHLLRCDMRSSAFADNTHHTPHPGLVQERL